LFIVLLRWYWYTRSTVNSSQNQTLYRCDSFL